MSICRFQFKARGKQYVLASEHDEEVARLNAKVESLIKAGYALASALILSEIMSEEMKQVRLKAWKAAREGKQP